MHLLETPDEYSISTINIVISSWFVILTINEVYFIQKVLLQYSFIASFENTLGISMWIGRRCCLLRINKKTNFSVLRLKDVNLCSRNIKQIHWLEKTIRNFCTSWCRILQTTVYFLMQSFATTRVEQPLSQLNWNIFFLRLHYSAETKRTLWLSASSLIHPKLFVQCQKMVYPCIFQAWNTRTAFYHRIRTQSCVKIYIGTFMHVLVHYFTLYFLCHHIFSWLNHTILQWF